MTRLPHLLASLPPLDSKSPFRGLRSCKICQGDAIPFDRVDFNKFVDFSDYYHFGMSGLDVTYQRCLSCGFIFTEDFDDWTSEEFGRLVYNVDYPKIDPEYVRVRPEQMAGDFAQRFHGCENARILDYGSGAGVFVDLMRQSGFQHIEAYDPFSSPIRPSGKFDIITCFEVIEHSPDPVGTVGDMKGFLYDDGCIIFSQTLQPPDILSVRGNWSYLAPRNGHVSTYSEEALVRLGRRHGLTLHRGSSIYGFAPPFPSSFANLALRCAGPSFDVLRLLAPDLVASRAIRSPAQSAVLWHATEDDGIWRYRWTGTSDISWETRWGNISTLQVRVPLFREVESGFALQCSLELNWQRRAVRMDRGEMMVEFEVAGSSAGQITLHMPDAVASNLNGPDLSSDAQGLAILVSQSPCISADPSGTVTERVAETDQDGAPPFSGHHNEFKKED